MARIVFDGHEGNEPTYEEILYIAGVCSRSEVLVEKIIVFDTIILVKTTGNPYITGYETIEILRGKANE